METFSYKAVSSSGGNKKGTIMAETKDEAVKKIKDMGLIPLEVSVQGALNKDINFSLFKKKVAVRDLCVFCRQFSSILKAGVNVVNALEMLGEETENKLLAEAVREVQSSVEKGETLADSMKKRPDAFPSLLVSMIAAGEASGSLEIAIDRMAIQFEKDNKVKGLIKKAMMYPIVLCLVAIGVVIVMMVYVIPSFMGMFEDLETELPLATKIVVAMSNFVIGRWYILLGIVVAIIVGYRAIVSTPAGRSTVDGLKLRIPVFGKLISKTACARFTRTLGTLLQAGMSMLDAIDVTAETMDNTLFRDALVKTKGGIGLGLSLSNQLSVSGLFPPMVVHMVTIGEDTGNIEEMLNNVANYYEEEVEVTTQQVTALMEPLIILVMAVVVGGLIMSIYGPMITLYNTLG